MAGIRLVNLTKKFGSVVAVNRVSLNIEDGHFVVLLGPSGCGKTTTLRCIAGLEMPDEGEIYIGDTLVNNLPPKDRDIAMVFQSYALYPHMTVYQNLAFPLEMRKIPKDEIKKRVKNVADLLGITDLLNRKPGQLSGGQQQRVALGRALVRYPKAFLMDEPLSNLDAKLRVYMRAELKKLQKDLKITTVYVTHDQVEAMTMADEIAIMNAGVVQQYGPPHEIYNRPANIFVAGFVGTPPMNFINCSLLEKGKSFFLDAGIFTLPLPNDIGKIIKERASSSELILGVRPEDIFIEKEKTQLSFIEADIYVTEPLGSETIVDLKLKDGTIIKAKSAPTSVFNIGEKVFLNINLRNAHIFDKKTEKAII
ncbi:MAG: ABC transporter ATP-binding protein [Candidatus Bathyarchaeia archaeon]